MPGHSLSAPNRNAATVPEGMRVYAVGDIHGRADLLDSLLERFRSGRDDDIRCTLVFLGDYVDRGPASRQVIERLSSLAQPGWSVVALRGNHDQMVLDFIDRPGLYPAWRDFGGAETLMSYGVRPPASEKHEEFARARDELVRALPEAHMRFLRSLPWTHILGDYMFVHAGVRPGVPLEQQSRDDLIWIRDDFLMSKELFGKVIVHGHTPTPEPDVRLNRIGVDTGAYATGRLTAVCLEGSDRWFISTV